MKAHQRKEVTLFSCDDDTYTIRVTEFDAIDRGRPCVTHLGSGSLTKVMALAKEALSEKRPEGYRS